MYKMLEEGEALGFGHEVHVKLEVPEGLDQFIREAPIAERFIISPLHIIESLANTEILGYSSTCTCIVSKLGQYPVDIAYTSTESDGAIVVDEQSEQPIPIEAEFDQ